ncbi:MAG: hypothetical protein V8Q84_02355 [Bilophila sp.]
MRGSGTTCPPGAPPRLITSSPPVWLWMPSTSCISTASWRRSREGPLASGPLPDGGSLTPAQRNEFYRLYARQFRGVSGALQAIALHAGFPAPDGSRFHAAADAVVRRQRPVFRSDLRRRRSPLQRGLRALQHAAPADGERKGRQYQEAVIARERSREAFIRQLKRTPERPNMGITPALMLYRGVDIEGRRVRHHPEKLHGRRASRQPLPESGRPEILEAAEKAAGAAQ